MIFHTVFQSSFKMWSSLFIATAALLVVNVCGQCDSRPKVNPFSCCPTAFNYVKPEQAVSCGYATNITSGGKGGAKGNSTGGDKGNGGGGGGRGVPSCDVTRCLFSQMNLLNSDSTVNRDALLTYMTQQYPSDWRAGIDQVVKMCSAKVRTNDACETGRLIKCMSRELIKVCPDSAWSRNDNCTKLKAFWTQCPNPPKKG